MQDPLTSEELELYTRSCEDNIRCMSAFALANGYTISENDEMSLGRMILSVIWAKRNLRKCL